MEVFYVAVLGYCAFALALVGYLIWDFYFGSWSRWRKK